MLPPPTSAIRASSSLTPRASPTAWRTAETVSRLSSEVPITSTCSPVAMKMRSRKVSALLASRTALVATARIRSTCRGGAIAGSRGARPPPARMLAAPKRPRRKVSCPRRTARCSRSSTSMRPSGRTSAMTMRIEFAPTSTAATVRAVTEDFGGVASAVAELGDMAKRRHRAIGSDSSATRGAAACGGCNEVERGNSTPSGLAELPLEPFDAGRSEPAACDGCTSRIKSSQTPRSCNCRQ